MALLALFIVEAIIFYVQFTDQIAPYYPISFDQLVYLSQSYQLLGAFFAHGWPAFGSQLGSAPQGATFPIQGAILGLVGGANRTAMISVNLAYFLALQAFVYWTIVNRTGRPYLGWVSISMIVSLVAVFHTGGIYDYRIDFATMCLYGIWICAILNSELFESRRWSIVVGLLGALLVSMRFITLSYVGTVLLVLFGLIVVSKWRSRDKHSNRALNCIISGATIILLAAPLIFFARRAIFNYYVVGHMTGSEKDIRAAEVGITSLLDHLVYYPRSIIVDQLGTVCLWIAGLALISGLLFGSNRWQTIRAYKADLLVLAISSIIPVVILTLDVAKSQVVGNTVSVPIILFVVVLTASLLPRVVGLAMSSVAIILALMAFVSHATAPQHYLSIDDLQTVARLNNTITKHLAESGITTPRLAFDRVDDFLNAPILALNHLEQSSVRNQTPLHVTETMGGIFAISAEKALEAVKTSDIVVITDQFKGRELPYPFNASMKEIWPQIADYSEQNLQQIVSGTIRGVPYRVYANASVNVDGLSGGWVTADGIVLSVSRFFLKTKPFIILEGVAHKAWLGGDPVVKAYAENGTSLPATYKSDGDHYRIAIDASAVSQGEGLASINLTFDRYFVPKLIGLNEDARKLVLEGPAMRSLMFSPGS